MYIVLEIPGDNDTPQVLTFTDYGKARAEWDTRKDQLARYGTHDPGWADDVDAFFENDPGTKLWLFEQS